MRIQSVETTGVKHFEERMFDFRDRSGKPAKAVVLLGGPGTGKTYLLEMLAAAKETIAPYGRLPEAKRFQASPDDAAKVSIAWWLSDEEAGDMDRSDALRITETMWGSLLSLVAENDADMLRLLARYDSDAPSGKLEYFPASRWLPLGGNATTGRHARFGLAPDNAKYDGLDAYVTELCLDGVARLSSDEASPLLGRFIATFASLCTSVELAGLVRTRTGIQPSFRRGKTEFPLADLSHSEREAFLLAATLCRSTLSNSVVLLDEPELRCAPSQLVQRVRSLLAFDASNQWIIATSHRALASELAQDAVVIDLGGDR